MTAILSHKAVTAQRMQRLNAADPDRMRGALAFLVGFDGTMFDYILDCADPADGDNDPDLAPFCQACGQDLGIFLKWGLDWRHYRGNGTFGLDHIEVLETDHAPVLAWRITETAQAPQ